MSDYPTLLSPGYVSQLGSHVFAADDIIRFARKFDPQPFHIDAELAGKSVFGGLCASGWHTFSAWMKCLRAYIEEQQHNKVAEREGFTFEFGPSPGFEKLNWLLPVMAGDTITYFNEIISIRPSANRPGWHVMQAQSRAINQHDKVVMTFISTVLLRVGKVATG